MEKEQSSILTQSPKIELLSMTVPFPFCSLSSSSRLESSCLTASKAVICPIIYLYFSILSILPDVTDIDKGQITALEAVRQELSNLLDEDKEQNGKGTVIDINSKPKN